MAIYKNTGIVYMLIVTIQSPINLCMVLKQSWLTLKMHGWWFSIQSPRSYFRLNFPVVWFNECIEWNKPENSWRLPTSVCGWHILSFTCANLDMTGMKVVGWPHQTLISPQQLHQYGSLLLDVEMLFKTGTWVNTFECFFSVFLLHYKIKGGRV